MERLFAMMTKQEKTLWNKLKKFHKENPYSLGSRVPFEIKNTKRNQKVVRDIAKWCFPEWKEKEKAKKEYKEFAEELLIDHKGYLEVREDLLWDYLMDKQA